MSFSELPVIFDCVGERLVGVATVPTRLPVRGVLVVVGGRQYRAGSHRQFVLLARSLAQTGVAAFRFDVRGMGDSEGEPRSFTALDDDIGCALAKFRETCPSLETIALCGLCDAATASVLYWQHRRDPVVNALCLINPWLRSEAGQARATVRHYYPGRLLEPSFWNKLIRGKIAVWHGLREYVAQRQRAAHAGRAEFEIELLRGLQDFPGPVLLMLSGRDLTAREFEDALLENENGRAILARVNVRRVDVAAADHTFSKTEWQHALETVIGEWMNGCV